MFRTDANNNPTAMTTGVAEDGGLVLGTDYEQGEPFQVGDETYYTAKLLGDPVTTTIRAIDKAGFFNNSGQSRWVYVAIPYFVWKSLTYLEKQQVIGGMYHREGGTAMRGLFPSTW